jgi:transcriptional regulator with GAF, ATPase, and Fis domain
MSDAWLQSVGLDEQVVAAVSRALRDAGVSLVPSDAHSPTIVAFDTGTDAVQDAIADACARHECVLALSVGEARPRHEEAWALLAAGALDVLAWNGAPAASAVRVRIDRWSEIDRVARSPLVRQGLVGESRVWRGVLRQLVEIACFTSVPVLLLGESGTGKEVAARVIHALDRRPDKRDLVILDCSTLLPELSGSEFFGHERGAYTGATAPRDGAFELARGGTLFLDEVGELSPSMQAQLLRVVQERTYKRVGGNAWQRTEFRLICATNRDLWREVERGAFRSDLYHRIAASSCRLPPLNDRRGDILPLAEHFLASARPDLPEARFSDAVQAYLLSLEYAGNVRELRQRVLRMAQRHVGTGPVTPGDVPEPDRPLARAPAATSWRSSQLEDAVRRALAAGAGLKEIGREAAEAAIRLTLAEERGNVQRAARRLGVTDRALQLRRRARRAGE